MIEKLRQNADYLLSIVFLVALVASARSFLVDVDNTLKYGGVDLRDRVVAARVLLEGMDPYSFKWSEEYPETLLNPIENPEIPVTRASFAPTVIMLHVPFARLPYSAQRILWLFAQWGLLLLTIHLFADTSSDGRRSKLVWITGLFISSTSLWRYHVERGQIYILYTFLVALSFWSSCRKWKYSHYLGGFILGFAVSLRPTIIVMAIPFVIFKQYKVFTGLIAGLLAAILICTAIFGISIWSHYLSSMKYFEKGNLGELNFAVYAFPDITVIEGMDNLRSAAVIPVNNTSLQYIFNEYFKVRIGSPTLIALLSFVLLLVSFWLYRNRGADIPVSLIYLMASVLVLITDYFLPATKSYYSEIMWLIPASLLILNADELEHVDDRSAIASLFFLLIGIYMNTMVYWEPYCLIISDYCVVIFFFLISALMISSLKKTAMAPER